MDQGTDHKVESIVDAAAPESCISFFDAQHQLIGWNKQFADRLAKISGPALAVGLPMQTVKASLTEASDIVTWETLADGGVCCRLTEPPTFGLGKRDHAATLLRAMVEQMPHMISIKEADSRRYVFCNAESEKVLGAQAVGKTNFEIFDRDDAERIDRQESALLESGGVLITEDALVRLASGEERRMSTKKCLVVDPDGTRYLVTISEDVTERHRQAAALQEAIAAANAANRAKSAFLATMSHEIRTPLNGVLGMAQAMAKDTLTATQAERLSVIQHSGRSLLTILNDILDLSKIEAGKLSLEYTQFDLGEVATDVYAAFQEVAKAKAVDLKLEIDDVRGVYEGDPTRLRQILNNLVSNAVKFTDAGTVRLRGNRTEDGVRISVQDSGIGMSADVIANIFSAYGQADSSTTRRFGGTGLGLTISRELASMMGGRIDVQSTPGQGSDFVLTVPLRRLSGSGPHDDHEPNEADDFAGIDGMKVLVADDNQTNRLVLKTLLDELGIDVMLVENGAEAVEAWRAGGIDVILMDVRMPVMDGPMATRCIRQHEQAHDLRPTPIIACTADAMPYQLDTCFGAGMDDFVTKPIEAAKLFAALIRAAKPSPA